jgi:hypothetical protein
MRMRGVGGVGLRKAMVGGCSTSFMQPHERLVIVAMNRARGKIMAWAVLARLMLMCWYT